MELESYEQMMERVLLTEEKLAEMKYNKAMNRLAGSLFFTACASVLLYCAWKLW